MCIGIEHPTIRLFARNTGSRCRRWPCRSCSATCSGGRQALPIGVVAAGSRVGADRGHAGGREPFLLGDRAAFRFTPLDGRGEWTIDDVYVDPYKQALRFLNTAGFRAALVRPNR